jgi:uncharacterized protein YifN (PemK superfamily)
MGIKYPVGIGTILLCDYSRGGFQPPEMVKKRPAVVISPRLPHRDGLCICSTPNAINTVGAGICIQKCLLGIWLA